MTDSPWLEQNLALRRRRDEIDAAKKRQEQQRQAQVRDAQATREHPKSAGPQL